MKDSIEIPVENEEGVERIVEVYDYTIHAATKDYFSRSWGQWYPGDPAEFYVEGARWVDTGAELSEAEWEKYGESIEDQAYEVASEPYEPDYDRDDARVA